MFLAMKSIPDRIGVPEIFSLYRRYQKEGGQLMLNVQYADYEGFLPEHEFVFIEAK
jgi:hypothetical protein